MLKLGFLLLVGVALAAIVTRATLPLRLALVLFGLMALYAVLKLTGAIEALAPDRMGYGVTLFATHCSGGDFPRPSRLTRARNPLEGRISGSGRDRPPRPWHCGRDNSA